MARLFLEVNIAPNVAFAAVHYGGFDAVWRLAMRSSVYLDDVRAIELLRLGQTNRWLSKTEAAALIRTAEEATRAPHLVDFIRLWLNTGTRRGEMLGLEWRRVDLARGLIYFEGRHQKNGKAGSVPLNREARAALIRRASFRAQYCPDSPWVVCDKEGSRIASVKKGFALAVRKAGIEDVHDLRRTCGSWLVQAGRPIHEVSALLRHSDIRVTDKVYTHLAPDNLRVAVQVLEETRAHSGHMDRFQDAQNE